MAELSPSPPEEDNYPVKIEEDYLQRWDHCLICCQDVNITEGKELLDQLTGDKIMGGHLAAFYILRHILGWCQRELVSFLITRGGGTSPGDWFVLCQDCFIVCQRAYQLECEIRQFTSKLKGLKDEVGRKIQEGMVQERDKITSEEEVHLSHWIRQVFMNKMYQTQGLSTRIRDRDLYKDNLDLDFFDDIQIPIPPPGLPSTPSKLHVPTVTLNEFTVDVPPPPKTEQGKLTSSGRQRGLSLTEDVTESDLRFSCHLCPYTSVFQSGLCQHLRLHETFTKACKLCNYPIKSDRSLRRHVLEKHSTDVPLQAIKTTFTPDKKLLQDEKVIEYADIAYNSGELGEANTPSTSRTSKGDTGSPLQCHLCPYSSVHKMGLWQHRRLHQKCTRICTLCKYPIGNENQLRRHMIQSHNIVNSCEQNGLVTEIDPVDPIQLSGEPLHGDDHQSKDVNQKSKVYTCDKCPYTSTHHSGLNQHVKTHEKCKRNCTLCNYPITTDTQFKRHMITQHGASHEEMYPSRTRYNIHSNTVQPAANDDTPTELIELEEETNLQPFFTPPSPNLYIPKEPKVHQCDLCPYSSVHKSGIRQHHQLHEKCSRICKICNYPIGTEIQLRRHMINAHNIADLSEQLSLVQEISQSYTTSARPKADDLDANEAVNDSKESQRKAIEAPDKVFGCNKCAYTTPFKSNPSYHTKLHDKCVTNCHLCNYPIISQHQLKHHLASHHGGQDVSSESHYNHVPLSGAEDANINSDQEATEHNEHDFQPAPEISDNDSDYSPDGDEPKRKYKRSTSSGNAARRSSEGGKLHTCDKCPYSSVHHSGLCQHARLHKKSTQSCDICNYPIITSRQLNLHMIKFHGANREEIFQPRSSYKIPTNLHTAANKLIRKARYGRIAPKFAGDKPYKCEECPYSSANTMGLWQHDRLHRICSRNCVKCNYPVRNDRQYRYHMTQSHNISINSEEFKQLFGSLAPPLPPKKLKEPKPKVSKGPRGRPRQVFKKPAGVMCPRCDVSVRSKKEMKIHEEQHRRLDEFVDCTGDSNTLSYQCKLCDYFGDTKMTILRHLSNRHREHLGTDNFHQCHLCVKTYANNNGLQAHIDNTHNDNRERRFSCDICSCTFLRKHSLALHMVKHTNKGVAHLICDICGLDFHSDHGLRNHKKDSHNLFSGTGSGGKRELKKTCSHCGLVVVNIRALKTHFKVSHPELYKFKCEECDAAYISSSNLRLHVKVIHLKEKEKCEKCGYYFKCTTIRDHMKRCQGETPKCFNRLTDMKPPNQSPPVENSFDEK